MKLAGWICFAPALIYAQAVAVTGTVANAVTRGPIPGVTVRPARARLSDNLERWVGPA